MTATASPRVPLEKLRDTIAEAVATHVKAYNVPAVTARWNLSPGTPQEASHSKRLYVKQRLLDMDEAGLLKLASAVVAEYGDVPLADLLSEMTLPGQHRLSEMTRRGVLKALNSLDCLFGETSLYDGLNIVSSETLGGEDDDNFGQRSQTGWIREEYQKHQHWSHETLLIQCGALSCTQARFFRLLEKLLEPVVRRGDEQAQLAAVLNPLLEADGFHAVVVGEQSRHPLYGIERIRPGVDGRAKNLIFAAINAKPDLYFTDAINNDIAIRNDTDALIYDEFLLESGLRWDTLTQWWQTQARITDLTEARRALYRRLLESVRQTGSPGQYALFSSYYHEYPAQLQGLLPALLPEVYLHYDSRTRRERGADPVLLRQRMDFLLLLDHRVRIVIEVDGSQHYADAGLPAPGKYAQMVADDRRLRLAGYELYRFGAAEFSDTTASAEGKMAVGPRSRQAAVEFFDRLWHRYGLKPEMK